MSLPDDFARCQGVSSVEDGVVYWREGCETCLRRTSPIKGSVVSWILPPAIIAFECEHLIEPRPLLIRQNLPAHTPPPPSQGNFFTTG